MKTSARSMRDDCKRREDETHRCLEEQRAGREGEEGGEPVGKEGGGLEGSGGLEGRRWGPTCAEKRQK